MDLQVGSKTKNKRLRQGGAELRGASAVLDVRFRVYFLRFGVRGCTARFRVLNCVEGFRVGFGLLENLLRIRACR